MRKILLIIVMGLLAACGGGDKATAPSNTAPVVTKITYSLDVDLLQDEVSVSDLTEGEPVRLVAHVSRRELKTQADRTVSDTTTTPSDVIVTFVTDGGTVGADNNQVLTDSTGMAETTLTPGSLSGAYPLTASIAPADGDSVQAVRNYQVKITLTPRIDLQVFKADGSPADTALLQAGVIYTVQATVLRVNIDNGIYETQAGVSVSFSSNGGTFEPSNATALTNLNGITTVLFKPPFLTGADTLSAQAELTNDDTALGSIPYQTTVPQLKLGFGSPFQEGAIGVDETTLAAGGTTTIRLNLVDSDLNAWDPVTVINLTSLCATSGQSQLPDSLLSINGSITATYRALTCSGTDVITATANIDGSTLSAVAQTSIEILPASAGTIEFDQALPGVIAIQGSGQTGQPEISEVSFIVRDTIGNPKPNQLVSFALTDQPGDVTLSTQSALSDNDGVARVSVIAGAVATTVRVRASVARDDAADLITQSGPIIIATGRADQDSFSLSATTLNVEGWNFDGVESTLIIRAADHANNWVPDGTQVLFSTEGGSINESCFTQDGACEVVFLSQNPRPQDGRVTITARTIGDESYIDLDGNGVYTEGEPFDDLPEAFRDDDEDRLRGINEEFYDYNNNAHYDVANNQYDGASCTSGCGQEGIDVREDIVLVLSTSHALIEAIPDPIVINNLSSRFVQIRVSDDHGNLMPAGTSVEIATTLGSIDGQTSGEVGNSNGPGPSVFGVVLSHDGESTENGLLTVTVTTPLDVVTTAQFTIQYQYIDPCSFSPPAPECTNPPEVGSITVNPSSITVQANQNQTNQVVLRVLDSNNDPMQGVTPAGECTQAGATDITASISSTIPQTNAQGESTVSVQVTTGAAPSGSASCTFSVGNQQTQLVIQP